MGYNLTKRNPLYELIADYTVSGSAITSYTFDLSATPLTKDEDYVLVSDINYTSSSWTDINLYFNNNVTPANYYSQWLYANVSTITSGRGVGTAFSAGQSGVSQRSFVITPIKLTNSSYITYQTTENRQYSGSYINLQNVCGTSTFTTSSISSINLRCTITGGIGIGSRFQLYRIRPASKIADVTIGSAVTSYTFDLSATPIGKGSEFMLVAFVNNTSASNSEYYLFSNNSIVNSSYYTQYFGAYSTTLESGRLNGTYCLYSTASRSTQSISNIKLTNNGYVVWQSCQTREVSASSIMAYNAYGTSTFTTSAITSLQITSSVASAIGIGSRFQLYRLK